MLQELLSEGIRSRIAPTPSGLLHIGNGINFIITWALTRAAGGQLLLRIDDLDKARYRREYVEDIFTTLKWLGIDYDEGPTSVVDFEENWSQHHRLDRYFNLLTELKAEGYLFACTCSRKDIRDQSADGQYPGTCLNRNIPFDQEGVAWRIKAPNSTSSIEIINWHKGVSKESLNELDAFVVRQKNGLPSYQIASLADDEYFGINLIVRGEDLWTSSLSQQYLAQLLHLPDFPDSHFLHHTLIRDGDGREKLSKSKGANALQSWREQGQSPAILYQMAAPILGLSFGISDGPVLVQAIRERYLEN